MKRWLKWGAAALIVVLLAIGVARALATRKAQQAALAEQVAQRAQTVLDLLPGDVLQAKTRELSVGLAVSGPLKAVNTALVKARVAGELQAFTLREGELVQAGQIVARVEPTEYQARLRQAQQQAASAKAQVTIAQRSFDNNRSLVEQGFISKTALDTSSASLASAQATYQAAQAAVDVAAKALDDTVLRAPISGTVSQRLAQNGERVGVDARVLEIVDLSRLELEASVSAAESMAVRLGQSARLRIEGASQGVTARVVRINPSAVAGSRAVLAYLAIDEPSGLRAGLFAQGSLETGRMQLLTIPLNAVRTDKPQPYVQLIDNNVVKHQQVELGDRGEFEGAAMVAVKGLSENTTLLSGSVGALREGTAVKLSAAAK
ncbi:efflux RND transporter periplasmic adaptor subunit [Rhodoferax sp.]|uniref:efflux RND transporter periplasmic adaptor subunit n=1 Tax=Rhodoferax sp. TaxID=50421 RepID=UPI002765F6FC|nr:efflux RND transporter periplasmic adaptor subunit [Rhodoferax sp.]